MHAQGDGGTVALFYNLRHWGSSRWASGRRLCVLCEERGSRVNLRLPGGLLSPTRQAQLNTASLRGNRYMFFLHGPRVVWPVLPPVSGSRGRTLPSLVSCLHLLSIPSPTVSCRGWVLYTHRDSPAEHLGRCGWQWGLEGLWLRGRGC